MLTNNFRAFWLKVWVKINLSRNVYLVKYMDVRMILYISAELMSTRTNNSTPISIPKYNLLVRTISHHFQNITL